MYRKIQGLHFFTPCKAIGVSPRPINININKKKQNKIIYNHFKSCFIKLLINLVFRLQKCWKTDHPLSFICLFRFFDCFLQSAILLIAGSTDRLLGYLLADNYTDCFSSIFKLPNHLFTFIYRLRFCDFRLASRTLTELAACIYIIPQTNIAGYKPASLFKPRIHNWYRTQFNILNVIFFWTVLIYSLY